ncbi:MAG TPA: hypothetical protein PKJ99_13720 [Thermoanaerobaculales bacterium]|nr:hypothetical protein [Thermoanaerobaculales bacterium]HQL31373.1 hypothetical protein [Thermoanaerobaculales bacterium]HQN95026.1 hypothetical protein [Thermoanaerobaculales bacterium]HQP44170.1 hypothetical protein [Thermoanaerobaculales bacterium]
MNHQWRWLLFVVLVAAPAAAQEVLLDRSLSVAGVTLFGSRTDPRGWYYLPDEPRIATGEQGLPEFSLVKYALPAEATGGGARGITSAQGGGVLHFLATYGVTEARLARAEAALAALDDHREDRILGPIQYRSGSFALVSSVAATDGGMARRVTGAGRAPLLEGGKVAVSVGLTPEGATFLERSLEMENPDISLAFSMEIEGYRSPYEADLVVDWDRVWAHQELEARAKIVYVGVEVDMLIDEMVTNGAIRVEVKGESSSMEALLDSAYAKVTEMMFDPAPPARAEQGDAGDLGNVVGQLLGSVRRSTVDLFAGYQLTRVKRSGTARISLRQQRAEPLFVLLTGNVGALAREWRDDPRFFRSINLEDPTFRTREVTFSFDGDAVDFAKVVNHLVVQLRKRHGDGSETTREAVLDPTTMAGAGNRIVFAYNWSGEPSQQEWLGFEWRGVWSFRGGRSHDTGWQAADAFAVALRPPYEVRTVAFDGAPETLESAGVRSVLARIEWDFLGEAKSELVTLRRGHWSDELELVLAADNPTYSVSLQWHLQDGSQPTRGPWVEESGVVYIDELPETRQ